MKVIAFNGSPHKRGNTYHSLKLACDEMNTRGIETEIVQVGGKPLRGCIDCGHCKNIMDHRCSIATDEMNDFIIKAIGAGGILIGSPVYFANMTPETKCLIDRLGRVTRNNGFLLKNKPGAAVVSARRSGETFTFSAINYLFQASQMPIVTSSHWNFMMAEGRNDWERDEEGLETMKLLGENMAWMLERFAD